MVTLLTLKTIETLNACHAKCRSSINVPQQQQVWFLPCGWIRWPSVADYCLFRECEEMNRICSVWIHRQKKKYTFSCWHTFTGNRLSIWHNGQKCVRLCCAWFTCLCKCIVCYMHLILHNDHLQQSVWNNKHDESEQLLPCLSSSVIRCVEMRPDMLRAVLCKVSVKAIPRPF